MASRVEEMLTRQLAWMEPAPLKRDNVDVVPLILDALASDAHVAAPDHAWGTGEGSGCAVLGDEAALRQILTNLLANARVRPLAHAASRDPRAPGEPVKAPASSMVTLCVADDWSNIPADIRTTHLRPFRARRLLARATACSSGPWESIVESLAARWAALCD